MVGHASDLEQDSPLLPKNSSEVFVETLPKRLFNERSAKLRAEHDVGEQIGEGV